jgi:4,4'-diaponeurosporenoate glycosyltransferase
MMYVPELLSLFFWLSGFFLLWKIPFCQKKVSGKETFPLTTIIIPARNEEKNLPVLLQSIKEQSLAPAEVIVVDDQSTDNTSRCAAYYGVRVIRVKDKPPDWIGKSWACWEGARNAKSDVFIFLDADTRLIQGGLAKILHEWSRKSGVVSIQPYHSTERMYEKLSGFLNIIIMAGINAFTMRGTHYKPAGIFGPCIVCSREDYFLTGGHEAIKNEVLEDVYFGRNAMACGIPVRCYGGKGSIHFRMYSDGMRALIDGWTKSFALGASGTRPLVLTCVILWIAGCSITPISLIAHMGYGGYDILLISAFLYLLYVMQVFWMFWRIGNFGFLTALLYPVPLLFFLFIALYSFVRTFVVKNVRWKGRNISLKSK